MVENSPGQSTRLSIAVESRDHPNVVFVGAPTEVRPIHHGHVRGLAGPDDRAVGASREVFAITRAAGYSSPRMGIHALHPSRQLAVPQQARPPLALTRPLRYPRRRMGTIALHPSTGSRTRRSALSRWSKLQVYG